MPNPVAVVTGMGPGTGAAIGRRFSRGGYAVAMLARTRDRLVALEREIERSRSYPCDVTDEAALERVRGAIRADLGTWTRQMVSNAPDEFFIKPAAIAEEVWHVAHQDRSAWSFNVELRPFRETW